MVILLPSEYSSDLLFFSKEVSLVISLMQVLIWIVIAALIGVWLLTKVVILTGIGDLNVAGVPLLRALIGAIILVAVWHLLTYRAWHHHRRNYYRRG